MIVWAIVLFSLVGAGWYGWIQLGKLVQPVDPGIPVAKAEKLFADNMARQLESARILGVQSPFDSRKLSLREKKQVVKIKTGKLYEVGDMMFSVPYLTEGAVTLLDEIAQNFADSLASKDMHASKPVVINALRTKEDIANLRAAGNESASVESPFCYGTTFDLSCDDFSRKGISSVDPDELKTVLTEVLRDEKSRSRCLVYFNSGMRSFTVTSLLSR